MSQWYLEKPQNIFVRYQVECGIKGVWLVSVEVSLYNDSARSSAAR